MKNFLGFLSLIAVLFLFFGLGVIKNGHGQIARDEIYKCEKQLPRDQHCEAIITAVPVKK